MSFSLTKHAQERIRQRAGIDADSAQLAWAEQSISESTHKYKQGRQTVYVTKNHEIICDGYTVVTIKPVDNDRKYVNKFGIAVANEARKIVLANERLLRKAEIKVAELTLNMLKARNPRTKELISGRLVEATDEKQRLADEIYAIKKAAGQYGVEV